MRGLAAFAVIAVAGWMSMLPTARGDPAGTTASALPGLARLSLPPTERRGVGAAASVGYGLTEGIAEEGSHHRAMSSLAASLSPLPYAAFAVRFDGRFDFHPDDGLGSDESGVGEPRLIGRVGFPATESVALGAELVVLVPGEDAPSVALDGTSVDTKLLAAWSDHRVWTFGGHLGFRLDQTGTAAPPPESLRGGDRLTLGASDDNAVLLAVGAAQQLGRLELLEELSWDVLVGEAAPSALESPLRATAGMRYRVAEGLTFALQAEVGLSSRPDLAAMDSHVPIEPRLSTLVGLRYLAGAARSAAPPPSEPTAPPPRPRAAEPEPEPAPETVAPTLVAVEGEVLNELGGPVAGATVTVGEGDQARSTESDPDGRFRFEELPAGPARVHVEGDNLQAKTLEQTITAGVPLSLAVERIEAKGTLRGAVASFGGRPVAARVSLDPGGLSVEAGADGTFALDVPPGSYKVTVTRRGYRKQVRRVEVEDGGVTVLNVELRGKR